MQSVHAELAARVFGLTGFFPPSGIDSFFFCSLSLSRRLAPLPPHFLSASIEQEVHGLDVKRSF